MKKYYDYGNIEYKGIRDMRNLINLPIDGDYDEPIKSNDAFKSNYIEYESKDKIFSIKKYDQALFKQ